MNKSPIESLSKYGLSFQQKCISSLLIDKSFIEQIYDILDENYFDNDAHRWIVTKIKKYFNDYKQTITLDVFKIELDSLVSDELKQLIIDQLKSIYTKVKDTDIVYVKEQFLEFCKNQKLKNAICESIDLLKVGQYEKIKHMVDEALKAGMEKNLGHDYHEDFDHRMNDELRSTVPTRWPIINELMDGGLSGGELGVILGNPGGAKSWTLVNISEYALSQGKNVVYFTLELNEKYVSLRHDACLTKIPFKEIRKNKEMVKDAVNGVSGKLKVKYYPPNTVSANTIKNYIDRMQMLGTKVDLIIIDYADLLISSTSEKGSNSYHTGGNIYVELRGVGGELQIPIWTVSQVGREANDKDIIEATDVSDSYKKIATADFIMSQSRKRQDKEKKTGRLHIIKNRFGEDGMTFPTHIDANIGEIWPHSSDSDEGQRLQELMGNAENDVKKQLLDKWNNRKK